MCSSCLCCTRFIGRLCNILQQIALSLTFSIPCGFQVFEARLFMCTGGPHSCGVAAACNAHVLPGGSYVIVLQQIVLSSNFSILGEFQGSETPKLLKENVCARSYMTTVMRSLDCEIERSYLTKCNTQRSKICLLLSTYIMYVRVLTQHYILIQATLYGTFS